MNKKNSWRGTEGVCVCIAGRWAESSDMSTFLYTLLIAILIQDCASGELCCPGPSCAYPKTCLEPMCYDSYCFGFSGVTPTVTCPDGSFVEAECVENATGFCETFFSPCP